MDGHWVHHAATKIGEWRAQEAGRLLLWAPVYLIIGIGLYFQWRYEPNMLVCLVALGGIAGGLVWGQRARRLPAEGGRSSALTYIGQVSLLIVAGMVLAQVRTMSVSAPVLPYETVPMRVEGRLLAIETKPSSYRYLIAPIRIGGIAAEELPRKVRLTWRGEDEGASVGDIVVMRGVLRPPPQPVMPGGFDYGRQLYFEQIGAVGYGFSAPRTVHQTTSFDPAGMLYRTRLQIAARVMDKAGPASGPVLAALVTGLRAQVPENIQQDLRDTGLAHLLAISGLHMGLVCGFLFVTLRSMFLLHPTWPLVYPVKKWAALGALLGGLLYLCLSGIAWSAQRAFIMAAISFVAILFDRQAISMRNVAVAALIIIVLRPEAVLSAGFQMSFAAVLALVAGYDSLRALGRRQKDRSLSAAPMRYLGGVCLTSLIAGGATAPFAIYHFGRIAVYGLVGNLLVMPLFSLTVIPIAVVGLAAMPLGLDAPLWWLAGGLLAQGLTAAAWVADWPGAVSHVPQWPDLAFLCLVGGLIILALLRAPWRLAGAALPVIGVIYASVAPHPVVRIGEGARNLAVYQGEGADAPLALLSRRRGRFAAQTWLASYGVNAPISALDRFGECGSPVCTVETDGGSTIAYAEDLGSALTLCDRASVIITPAWPGSTEAFDCKGLLLTGRELERAGGLALYPTSDGQFRIATVAEQRGTRPWTR